jgi:non-homologous end joining protein Ku
MPRASWRDFLRLSLVYLSPATTRTKPLRLHPVWQPRGLSETSERVHQHRSEQVPDRSAPPLVSEGAEDSFEQACPATRIALRPHDPSTGEEVEKEEIVKGYEFERGQFVAFTA